MAQDILPKQTNFVSRYGQFVTEMIRVAERAAELKSEYDGNAYAPDGTSPYKLTDEAVQAALPHATATQFLQCVGAVESIRGVIASNRGYLEALRP